MFHNNACLLFCSVEENKSTNFNLEDSRQDWHGMKWVNIDRRGVAPSANGCSNNTLSEIYELGWKHLLHVLLNYMRHSLYRLLGSLKSCWLVHMYRPGLTLKRHIAYRIYLCFVYGSHNRPPLCINTALTGLCNGSTLSGVWNTNYIQGVPGGMCKTSGECSLC